MNHRAHLHSIHLPISEIGTPYLWFDSLSGTESINDLFHYQLIVKTKDALGRPAHGIVGLDGYVNADHYHQTLTQADPLSQQTAADPLDQILTRVDAIDKAVKNLPDKSTTRMNVQLERCK